MWKIYLNSRKLKISGKNSKKFVLHIKLLRIPPIIPFSAIYSWKMFPSESSKNCITTQ